MNILNAFIRSSSNPENISLFIKSLATVAVLAGLDVAIVDEVGGFIFNFLVGLGMFASSITGLYGLARKVYLSRWSAKPSDTFVND